MSSKYGPLSDHLRTCGAQGGTSVEMALDAIDELVGGLPPSARRSRTWWANGSNTQARAWREAGWHVHTVDLAQGRVIFATGRVGGSRTSPTGPIASGGAPSQSKAPPRRDLDSVDVNVHFVWQDAGQVILGDDGKPTFGPLPAVPGLYRLTMIGAPGQARTRVYIGETDQLRRRLSGNYRNPGPSQTTSIRINALLREHLGAGGTVQLAVATAADCVLGVDREGVLDLTRKAGRLLAENAALVVAQVTDDADIENLG